MHKAIAAGVAGGAIGGVVFEVLMRLFPVGTEHRSMVAFAADLVRAGSPLAGWLVYPVYGIAIGALFGWLLGDGALVVLVEVLVLLGDSEVHECPAPKVSHAHHRNRNARARRHLNN